MKYKEWLKEWLDCFVKTSSKRKTYIRYSETVACHVTKPLGDYELGELTPLILQRYVNGLSVNGNTKTGKGLSANSVNLIVGIIRNSLKCAREVGLISENAAYSVKRPKITEKEVSCFSYAEQKTIEHTVLASRKPKMFGVLLCLYTGLRIGELLALTWNDLDFESGVISVTKTCYDGKDNDGKFARITDTPKTKNSKRLIPVPKQLIAHLRKIKRGSKSEYVIVSKDAPISVRSYQRSFETLLKRLDIPHKGFHALRHTFATRALECGMDVKTLSEILGHKNSTVTLNRYVHSLMEHKRDMMDRLGKLLPIAI